MARPMGPRALQPSTRADQVGFAANKAGYTYLDEPQSSPAWYEAEQRMAPSYILPPQSQLQSYRYKDKMSPQQQPPISPSARWNTASQRPQRQSLPPPASARSPAADGVPFPSPNNLPPGAAMPYNAQQPYENATPLMNPYDTARQPRPNPSRLTASRFQSFPAPESGYAPGQSGRAGGTTKGSAFMHKGFFDIMQLANDRQAQSVNPQLEAPSPSKFRATLSRATGPLRKVAGAGTSGKAGFAAQDVEGGLPGSYDSRPTSMASNYLVAGPRAAKKRISIDMVSSPRPESFVHAAHASDAEQAEAILSKWGRDGVGKVADPAWVVPIKEALRLQAARNQAEAIAQVQAAMHQDSFIRDQPRQLHIVNGQPSTLTTTSTLTAGTVTTAGTAGHGSVKTVRQEPRTESSSTPATSPRPLLNAQQAPWTIQFNDIAEEGRTGSDELDNLPPPRPPMMPRANTAGTVLVNPTPSPNAARQAEAPDYMLYKKVEEAASPNLNAEHDEAEEMAKLAIDGLPGATAANKINRMFDPPSPGRPASILVKEAIPSPQGEAPALKFSELSQPMVQAAGRALRPSLTTVEKSVAAKIYFENLYYGILKKPAARETRRAGLERELAALRIPDASKELIRQAWISRETEHLRDVRARVSANSFVKLKTIGHGAFGVVALVREKHTGQLFAMKQLRKADMLRKGQEGHVRAERDLMTSASASGSRRWIVNLVYSFQDVDHLYLIMEFMGGGDLLNLLIEKDIFAEDFARFYVAEMILTIREAHRLGYIHRDIKPDNFLFTAEGHIKLADFGLCQSFHWAHDGAYYDQQRRNLLRKHGIDLDDAGGGAGGARSQARGLPPRRTGRAGNNAAGGQLNAEELDDVMSDRNPDGTPLTHVLTFRDKNKKKIAYSVVGTNNYMAPEVLRGLGYDQSCDWWSLGVIVFEMLYGYPPFVSKSRHLTRQKILNWKQTLRFPPKPKVSREAQDFISKLICEREDRLGSTSSASVSRPNSMLQNARQQSGFASGMGGSGTGATASGVPSLEDGAEDLMSHPWFKGIDWSALHRQKTPFRPDLAHPADTKHFEDDIDDEPLPAPGAAAPAPGNPGDPKPAGAAPAEVARDPMLRDRAHGERLLEMRKQLAFVGYTFKRPPGFDVQELQGAAEGEGEGKSGGAAGFLGGLFGFVNTSGGGAAATAPSAEPEVMETMMDEQPLEPTEGGSRVRSMSM